jgi:hypothetical protein
VPALPDAQPDRRAWNRARRAQRHDLVPAGDEHGCAAMSDRRTRDRRTKRDMLLLQLIFFALVVFWAVAALAIRACS